MKLLKFVLLFVLLFNQHFSFARKVKLGIDTYWGMGEFETLKENFPTKRMEHSVQHFNKASLNNKGKKDVYGAHCAINLSEALLQSGFHFGNNKAGKCSDKYDCETGFQGHHILMASSLARVLKEKYREELVELTGSNYLKYVKGKKGIIYFEDYWSRNFTEWETQKPTGDHIDLWDGNKLVSYKRYGTFVRNYLTNHKIENKGKGPSPLRKAAKVYFFEME